MKNSTVKISDLKTIIEIQNNIVQSANSVKNKTKLAKALVNFNGPLLEEKMKELDKEMGKKRLEVALTGKNGEVLEDAKGKFLYDKKGLEELKGHLESLLDQSVSIELMQTDFNDLSKEEKDVFCDNENPEDMKLGWTEKDIQYLKQFIKF